MENEIYEGLKKGVLEYNAQEAAKWAKKAVEEKLDLMKALEIITQVSREVGNGFQKGELWLPDLVGVAAAISGAMPVIEREIKRIGAERASLGIIVIGTVFGDIHSIGKQMVSALLIAEGFEVHDIGQNIKAGTFIEEVKKHNADILAMSALLTVTAPEQKKVIEALKKEGLRKRVKVMVGGGAVTEKFASDIEADGYDPTAPGAAKLARGLLGK